MRCYEEKKYGQEKDFMQRFVMILIFDKENWFFKVIVYFLLISISYELDRNKLRKIWF